MEEVEINSFTELVAAMPHQAELAQAMGVSDPNVVAQWKRRNRIPPRYWRRLIRYLPQIGLEGFDLEAMCELEEARHE